MSDIRTSKNGYPVPPTSSGRDRMRQIFLAAFVSVTDDRVDVYVIEV